MAFLPDICKIRNILIYLNTIGIYGFLLGVIGTLFNTRFRFKLTRRDCQSPIWLRVPSSDVLTCEQIFISEEYKVSTEILPKVIVDAGANTGLTSIYFANKFPDAKIIAIEPEQSNIEMLKLNTAPYPNIIPIQAALWHRNEEIDLVDPGLGHWGFMTAAGEDGSIPPSQPATRCGA